MTTDFETKAASRDGDQHGKRSRPVGRESSPLTSVGAILQLQRTAGNRAVQGLMAANQPLARGMQVSIRPVDPSMSLTHSSMVLDDSTNSTSPAAQSNALRLQRQPQTKQDTQPQPSAVWYEVNDAHQKLFTDIGQINLRVTSLTRGEWMARVSSAWAQIGEGNKSDEQLKSFLDQLRTLKAEIAEEVTQARESWKIDVGTYQEERKLLQTEKMQWTENAIEILDAKYMDTERAVKVAGSYLTFDDLRALEYTLTEKKHREYAQTRYARANDGPDSGSTLAMGAGLGAIVTYQGKTLVRLGNEKFYVSGTPPKGGWTPKGGTTSVLFVYKKSDIKKMYRLDWDTIKMGPKQGQLGWEHNQKGVAKVLNLKITNHQPAGGWGRAAGTALRIYKWGGRALFVAGLVASAVEIYYAENKSRAIAKAGGAIVGGIGGAKLGAAGGAEAGSLLGPVGAGIGAFVGGLVGGAVGAWVGSKATEYVYDLVVDRLEDEDDWVVLTQDQVEPTRSGSGSISSE